MDIDRTVGYGLLVGLMLSVGACAKGSDLKEGTQSGGDGEDGGSTASVGLGGKTATGAGGKVTSEGVGGETVSEGAGGRSVSKGGGGGASGSLGLGGSILIARGGAGSTAGAAGASDTGAPVSGLGVYQLEAAPEGGGCPLKLNIENKSGAAVDLKTVTIRYYFTIDGWTDPVAEVYYDGGSGAKAVTPPEIFETSEEGADHYIEIAFTAGSLANNGVLGFQGALHDGKYSTDFDPTNDYSFTGLQGYNDHITVYLNGALNWGFEPGSDPSTGGTGGATGVGGADAGGAAGEAGAPAGEAGAAAGEGGSGGDASGGTSSTDGGASGDGGTSSVEAGGAAGESVGGDAGAPSATGGSDAAAGGDGSGGAVPAEGGGSSLGGVSAGDAGGAAASE